MEGKDVVFISHATPADNTFAVWLATKLELCGYKVWVDINNLSPSVDFWKTIEDTIRNKAAKFLFVASSSSVDPDRDGIKKELAVADKIRRNNPIFITPIRIDSVSYNDFPVEILRLNAIDFKNDWAKGLETLLKTLEEEKIPKAAAQCNSQYYLNRWNTSQAESRSLVTDDPEEYCSNIFAVDKPPFVYAYPANDVEGTFRERHIPFKKNKSIIISFACWKCVSEWIGRTASYEVFETSKLIDNSSPMIILGEKVKDPSRDVISLINWSVGEMFFSKRLKRYRPASEKTSKNVYYFPYGVKSKRHPNSRYKFLSGTYKGKKQWHFGLSAFYSQYPSEGMVFKWHLLFSDDKGAPVSDSAQIAARRSKGKMMFNKQWKDLLLTAVYYLADGTENIYYSACCEENAMYIRSKPERYLSTKGYPEPKQKQVIIEDV